MTATKAPHLVDEQVGARVRMRRLMLGMSQEELAEGLGLTFQQVQKYEKGTNRISASRLQQIAQILQVPVSFLFQEFEAPDAKQAPSWLSGFLATKDGLALTKAFMTIRDRQVRRRIVQLVEAIAR